MFSSILVVLERLELLCLEVLFRAITTCHPKYSVATSVLSLPCSLSLPSSVDGLWLKGAGRPSLRMQAAVRATAGGLSPGAGATSTGWTSRRSGSTCPNCDCQPDPSSCGIWWPGCVLLAAAGGISAWAGWSLARRSATPPAQGTEVAAPRRAPPGAEEMEEETDDLTAARRQAATARAERLQRRLASARRLA